jgi:hypothetical protein
MIRKTLLVLSVFALALSGAALILSVTAWPRGWHSSEPICGYRVMHAYSDRVSLRWILLPESERTRRPSVFVYRGSMSLAWKSPIAPAETPSALSLELPGFKFGRRCMTEETPPPYGHPEELEGPPAPKTFVRVSVRFPLWPLPLLFAIYPTIVLIRGPLRRRRRRKRGLCIRCGYDLTGNVSGVCPECATPAAPHARSREAAAKD